MIFTTFTPKNIVLDSLRLKINSDKNNTVTFGLIHSKLKIYRCLCLTLSSTLCSDMI